MSAVEMATPESVCKPSDADGSEPSSGQKAAAGLVAFRKSKNRRKKNKKGKRNKRQNSSMAIDSGGNGGKQTSGNQEAQGVVKEVGRGQQEEDEEEVNIVHVSTKRKKTVNTFGSTTRKVSRRTRDPGKSEDPMSSTLETADNAEQSNAVSALSVVSDRSTKPMEYSGGATAIAQFDTAAENDARAIRERNIDLNESGVADDSTVYRGEAGYKNYIRKDKNQLAANKYTGTQGPIRPSVFFRPSFRMDYQPDICKDYKETGYCGYGDTCKFLHDRGNYKQGWQIEQDFQAQEKKRLAALTGETVEDDPDFSIKKKGEEELPFACFICRNEFTDPVETKCGHFFCEKCALDQYRKSSKCFVCGKDTRGVFNTARKIIQKMEQRDRKHAVKRN